MEYEVIVQTAKNDPPKPHEYSAACIVANYFQHKVIIERPQILKTPDFIVGQTIWELKSPIGDGKNTIHNLFITARKQSPNLIIDLRRCKMNEQKAIARIRDVYNKRRKKKCRILIILKSQVIVDICDYL